ncbi:MAG: PhnD/SsuA/transferrin family substrate-binding protein [Thermodesulfobacteriota bacterium]
MKQKIPFGIPLFLLMLALLLVTVEEGAAGKDPGRKFFFFHPDSAQNNLSQLKSQMDGLLSGAGLDLQFQPFNHFADFDTSLRQQKPAFQWVPEWYVAKYGEPLGLKRFLVAVRQGKSLYRKVLICSGRNRQNLQDLDGRTLAMTTLGPDGHIILRDILFTPLGLNDRGLTVVEVPKDSDALLALMLGQVDLALVGEDNLDVLRRLNGAVDRNVVQMERTLPLPMPVLCYRQDSVPEEELNRMKDLFLQSPSRSGGREFMEMLQIDAWQTIAH